MAQKFNEIKDNHKSCGFDRKTPKLCCPTDDEKRTPKHSKINGYK